MSFGDLELLRQTPQRQAYERSPAFKQGQRFRAGIEGRMSVLMRAEANPRQK
jgi:transposase, IS5 family